MNAQYLGNGWWSTDDGRRVYDLDTAIELEIANRDPYKVVLIEAPDAILVDEAGVKAIQDARWTWSPQDGWTLEESNG